VNDKASIRKTLQIPMEATVFVYCGRLRKEKGTDDLVNAFINLKARTKKSIHLLLLGKYEAFDSVSEVIKEYISLQQDITLIDWSREVEKYFAISDVFVFPSYREGFGNVAIEASAMKLPVIGYDVVGLRESIDNHCSGLLVPKSNVFLLSSAMEELLNNDGMRKRLGENGRGIVESFFSNQVVWENLLKFYNKSIVD
jgi:glycosyltransferase involved in cell wall biosynthesis